MKWSRLLIIGSVLISYAGNEAYASPSAIADSVVADNREDVVTGGVFVHPNEFRFSLYHTYLKNRQGVLIGVGTFRVFEDLSQGNFSHGICFDYDSGVVAFNRWLISLLKGSKGRLEFLAGILGDVRFIPVFREFEAGAISTRQLVQALKAREPIPSSMRPLLSTIYDYDAESSFARFIENTIHKIYAEGGVSFLRSDSAFNRVKSLADEGKIEAIHGNISGSHALKSLATVLKAKKLKVSVVDVSNALYYVPSENKNQFLSNLKSLPHQDDTLVFFVEAGRKKPLAHIKDLNWQYHVVTLASYYADLSSVFHPGLNQLKHATGYLDFLGRNPPLSEGLNSESCVGGLTNKTL